MNVLKMSPQKFILYIAILFTNVVLNGQSSSDEFSKANKLFENGNYEESFNILKGIVEANSLDFPALELLTNASIKLDKTKDVLKILDNLLEENPSVGEYYLFRAVIYLQLQRYNKSQEDLDNALTYEVPGNYRVKVYLNRGMLQFQLGEYDLAEKEFTSALQIDPKNAIANHSLGMLKYETQQYDEAISYFVKALKQDDKSPITHYNLGMTYLKIEDKENACYYFNKACDLGYKNACKMLYLQCTR